MKRADGNSSSPKKRVQHLGSAADYEAALKEIAVYFEREPEPGSEAAARFDTLAALIGAYEDEHWPIEPIAGSKAVGA